MIEGRSLGAAALGLSLKNRNLSFGGRLFALGIACGGACRLVDVVGDVDLNGLGDEEGIDDQHGADFSAAEGKGL